MTEESRHVLVVSIWTEWNCCRNVSFSISQLARAGRPAGIIVARLIPGYIRILRIRKIFPNGQFGNERIRFRYLRKDQNRKNEKKNAGDFLPEFFHSPWKIPTQNERRKTKKKSNSQRPPGRAATPVTSTKAFYLLQNAPCFAGGRSKPRLTKFLRCRRFHPK